MSFLHPWWLLALIPILWLFLKIKERSGEVELPKELIIQRSGTKYRLIPIVLALLILALARPVLQTKRLASTSIHPLFIALDVSASMRASDLKPSRLEWAKKAIEDLIHQSPMKVSLIVFTSNPLIIAPPTDDKEMALWALKSFDTHNILTRSTDIQKLLDFVAQFEGKKELVIFSDGGDAKSYRKPPGVRIHFVHTATRSGSAIPNEEGFIKQNGKLVVSQLNPALEKIADFNYEPSEYLNILDNIQYRWGKSEQSEMYELYIVPLLLAIILTLYIFTTLLDSAKKLWPLALVIQLHAGILDEIAIKQGYEAYKNKEYRKSAKIFQKLPYLEARYALAMNLMRLGKYDDALKIFSSIQTNDPKIAAMVYKNMGICYEKMRNYEKAREYLIKAAQYRSDEEIEKEIAKIVFKKNEKKPPPPFAKQKRVLKKSPSKTKQKKGAGGSNMQSALMASNAKGGKKSRQKQEVLTKKGSRMPMSSQLYEMINKGYIHESHPW